MKSLQPLARLPLSHIDLDWLSTVKRASRTMPREFYKWAADHILRVTGSLPEIGFSSDIRSVRTAVHEFRNTLVSPSPFTARRTRVLTTKTSPKRQRALLCAATSMSEKARGFS